MNKIKELRKALNLNISDFAFILNMNESTLQKYDKGIHKKQQKYYPKIKEVVGVDLNADIDFNSLYRNHYYFDEGDLRNKLLKFRLKHNLTQREMAAFLKCAYSNYCDIENKKRAITIRTLYKFKLATGIKLKDYNEYK